MQEKIKKAGMQISVYMGIAMSFFLSLMENLISGHFSLVLFAATFAVSTTLSLVIGVLVPMGPLTTGINRKLKLQGLPSLMVSSLVSDLIYTPVLTLAMIAIVRVMLPKEALANLPPFIIMFVGSLIPAMIVGFILIMILMPFFQKMVFKKLGIGRPEPGNPEKQ